MKHFPTIYNFWYPIMLTHARGRRRGVQALVRIDMDILGVQASILTSSRFRDHQIPWPGTPDM
jgi:hypothetical protein